jgi:glycosyltransferase involved in cell wall biosynthesis
MRKFTISIVIATKNEEKMIKDCLNSVKWADEIILIDDYSEDKTVEIAKKFGAKVFLHKWLGFSGQKNYGFRKARGDWVLFLDADERVTAELKDEILGEINKTKNLFSGYDIPRLNNILGKDMYFGGWYPDYQRRLVRREKFRGWRGKLHEEMIISGEIGVLKNNIYHITHRSISWMVNKSIIYSKIEAEELFRHNHPKMTWWRFFRPMIQEFLYRLVRKMGWRDGIRGWIEAIYQSFSRFLVYAYLWEIQNSEEKRNEL